MSYFLSYVTSESGAPVDGEQIATTTGWLDWGTWVLNHAADYSEIAHLAQEGWNEGVESLTAIEHELEQAIHEMENSDISAISAQLLAGLRAKPVETIGVIVTDGESNEDGGEGS